MEKWRNSPFLFLAVSLILLLSSCNLPRDNEDLSDVDLLKTAARQTVEARLTENVEGTDEGSPTPTATGEEPGDTQEPTPSPTATTQAPNPPTNTPRPCNKMEFVNDVTIPDGTEIVAGDSFTKTWRLKNTGTCTWTSGYRLVFESGDRMDAPDSVQLTSGSVGPGETVDVSVDLTAPDTPGTYRGYFVLRSPENVVFGLGAGQGFWVEIEVIPADTPTPTATATATATDTTEPKPDLVINQIEFNPDPPVEDNAVIVSVQVYNQGDAIAVGPFTVEWYGGENFTNVSCTWTFFNINPSGGQIKDCSFTYQSNYSGINTKAEADTTNTVDESDETNNVMLKEINVVEP
jgi:hypothetical protein